MQSRNFVPADQIRRLWKGMVISVQNICAEMGINMKIHDSAEDYLETILILKERTGQVRSIDIATEMNYSKPSISVAMKKLRENGYIVVDKDGFITLTDAGYAIASNIYNRHRVLTAFFISLGVNEKTAAEDACKIEHDLSEETFEKIRQHAMREGAY